MRSSRILLHVVAAALLGCGSPPSPAAPPEAPPDLAAAAAPGDRPRLTVQDVFQGDGAERIKIGSFVYDTRLKTPVGPAMAGDGQARWIPIADWVPWAEAAAAPAASHSASAAVWLDASCQVPLAFTTAGAPRPRYVWQRQPHGIDVWQVGNEDLSAEPLWSGSPGSCVPLGGTQRQALLKDRRAWRLGLLLDPSLFVAAQFSAHERVNYGGGAGLLPRTFRAGSSVRRAFSLQPWRLGGPAAGARRAD